MTPLERLKLAQVEVERAQAALDQVRAAAQAELRRNIMGVANSYTLLHEGKRLFRDDVRLEVTIYQPSTGARLTL